MEELGIPGHASKRPSMHRLQQLLRELGLSFEAEGETVRIHVGGIVLELSDYGEEIQVQVEVVPEPAASPEENARSFYLFGLASALIRAEEYGVERIAGYTMIWASRSLGSLEEAVNLLEGAVMRVASAASNPKI